MRNALFHENHGDSWSATTGGRGSHPAAPPHLIKEILPQMAGGGLLLPRWRVTLTMTEMKKSKSKWAHPPGQKQPAAHLSWEFLVQMRSLASIECDSVRASRQNRFSSSPRRV